MIRPYKKEDFNQIVDIAYSIWSDEILVSNRLKDYIYKFLIEYYASENELTFVDEEDSKINGFALAYKTIDHNKAINNFKEAIKDFTDKEKEDALSYISYIVDNTEKVNSILNEDDVYFGLLASIKHGVGKELVENLKETSKKLNMKRILFWTDETCNYKYYEQKGYSLIDSFIFDFFGTNIKGLIYKIDL